MAAGAPAPLECLVWEGLDALPEAMQVALEARHPKACVLPDVYHLYKGGSEFNGLRMIAGQAIQVFHMNDYPKDPPRETIKDADRVYPGDGIAPLAWRAMGTRAGGEIPTEN